MKHVALLACALSLVFALPTSEASARPGGGRAGGARAGGARAGGARPNVGSGTRPSGNFRSGQSPNVNRPSSPGNGIQNRNPNFTPLNAGSQRAPANGRFNQPFDAGRGGATADQLSNFLGTPRQNPVRDGQPGLGRFDEQRPNAGQRAVDHYDPNHRPFSPDWYSNHPNAWRYHYPHAGAWAAASWGMAAGWLGYAATTPPVTTGSVYVYNTEETSPEQEEQVADATQLADQGASTTDDASTQWLPLGVYDLQTDGQSPSTVSLQLAISQDGTVRGNYYDQSTDTTEPIQGALDHSTQRVAWRVGNDPTVYETQLYDLTAESTPVWLHSSDGQTSRATLVRVDQDSSNQAAQ